MNVSEVPPPPPPPPEMSENGSAVVAPETLAGHDSESYSVAQTTEHEEGETLPADFERLWKAAHDNPQDFTSWTDLLQYCEQEVCVGVN